MKRFLTLVLVCVWSAVSPAAPSVTLDRVQQRYPYGNQVDVDYTVSGMDGCAEDYRLDLSYAATAGGAQVAGTATNFVGVSRYDLPLANGGHRVTWDAAADGARPLMTNATVTLKLVKSIVTESEADYMIVDLSAGWGANVTYPVRYVRSGADYASSHFNSNLYKTDKMVFKKVRAGTFKMGEGNVSAEGAGVPVRLTKDFWLAVFPLTQRQYRLITGNTATKFTGDTGTDLAAERAICSMNYDHSINISNKLTAKAKVRSVAVTGWGLPTVAQWEYACRAGTQTTYWWGDDSSVYTEKEWISANANSTTHPVGQKACNPWGFYDMLGNVFNWSRDFRCEVYPAYSATEENVDPERTAFDKEMIGCGNTWHPNFGGTGRGCGTRFTTFLWPNQDNGGWNPTMITSMGLRFYKEVRP